MCTLAHNNCKCHSDVDSDLEVKILKLSKANCDQYYAILSCIPEITYEKVGNDYIGSAVGRDGKVILSRYLCYSSAKGAFGGSVVHITMKDGSGVDLKDNWYDAGYCAEHGEFVGIGAATVEGFQRICCYYAYNIEKELWNRMLDEYFSRERLYSFDTVEKWCNLQCKWYDVRIDGKKIPIMVNECGKFADRETKDSLYPVVNKVVSSADIGKSGNVLKLFNYSYADEEKSVTIERKLYDVLLESLGKEKADKIFKEWYNA